MTPFGSVCPVQEDLQRESPATLNFSAVVTARNVHMNTILFSLSRIIRGVDKPLTLSLWATFDNRFASTELPCVNDIVVSSTKIVGSGRNITVITMNDDTRLWCERKKNSHGPSFLCS
jgi:hypothetical protein